MRQSCGWLRIWTPNFRLRSGSTPELTKKDGNGPAPCAMRWWKKDGGYMTTSNIRRLKAQTTAKEHGPPASIRCCVIYFRRNPTRIAESEQNKLKLRQLLM